MRTTSGDIFAFSLLITSLKHTHISFNTFTNTHFWVEWNKGCIRFDWILCRIRQKSRSISFLMDFLSHCQFPFVSSKQVYPFCFIIISSLNVFTFKTHTYLTLDWIILSKSQTEHTVAQVWLCWLSIRFKALNWFSSQG